VGISCKDLNEISDVNLMLTKIAKEIDNILHKHLYPRTFLEEGGRVVTSSNDGVILEPLILSMKPNLRILYVLHTPRGEGKAARYESRDLGVSEAIAFARHFQEFLSSDARFDIWFHSEYDQSLLVYDRHNIITCYGNTVDFIDVLVGNKYGEGRVEIPKPHFHFYHEQFDPIAIELLNSHQWVVKDLREEDYQ